MRLERFLSCVALLLFTLVTRATAFAQGAGVPAETPGFGEVLMRMLPMFLIVFFIFYFMILKPQQAKLKAHQNLIDSLKKGDNVVTSGGIIGRVSSLEKDAVLLEIASGVRIKVEKGHVSRKVDKDKKEESAKDAA